MFDDQGRGRPISTSEGAQVDHRVVADLETAGRDLAASVLQDGLGRSERLSRAERATTAARNLRDWVGALDPYRSGEHSRLVDMLTASGHRAYAGLDAAEAADRLMLARAHDRLQHRASLNQTVWTTGRADQLAPTVALDDACPLLDVLAAPIMFGEGPAAKVPGPWSDVPDAVTGWDLDMDALTPQLDEIASPLLAARWVFNVAHQAHVMAPGFAAEYEALARHQVRVALEAQMVASLVAAGAAAATWQAAEVAVGTVWTAGADCVLVAGADAPKVRRAYAGDFPDPVDRPMIFPSAGLTAGTAIVLAAAGVRAETTPVQWLVTEAPRVLGREVGAFSYGRLSVRVPGSVQLVTVA